MGERLPRVWDYDITVDEFRAMLAGQLHRGRLGQDWAAVRLIEYAPYEEIVAWLGFAALAKGWPQWREKVRSADKFIPTSEPVDEPADAVDGLYYMRNPVDAEPGWGVSSWSIE